MTPSIQERFLQALQTGNTTRIELYLKKYPEAATMSIPDVGSPLLIKIAFVDQFIDKY